MSPIFAVQLKFLGTLSKSPFFAASASHDFYFRVVYAFTLENYSLIFGSHFSNNSLLLTFLGLHCQNFINVHGYLILELSAQRQRLIFPLGQTRRAAFNCHGVISTSEAWFLLHWHHPVKNCFAFTDSQKIRPFKFNAFLYLGCIQHR